MAALPSPRRRKVRSIRPSDSPDDLLVVVRATPAVRADAIDAIAATAAESAGTYVLPTSGGTVELLFGVSVFALRPGVQPLEVLSRFPFAPTYVAATVGALRAAGLPVLATGSDPDHYEVQLLPGRPEGSLLDDQELRRAAGRLLDLAGDFRPNPAYAVHTDEGSEDEG